jgi:hypothetical protein
METNQPAASVNTPVNSMTGIFGSKVPASVAFIVAFLLFFMPFIDIRCNNMSLQTVTGFQLATGFKMKNNSSDNSFFNDMKTDKVDQGITKATTQTDEKDPNLYAMIALGLALLGSLLSFVKGKLAIGGAMVTGIAGAGIMIGLFLDIKNKVKMDELRNHSGGEISNSFDDIGKQVTDKLNLSVDFTTWFYIAFIAFLAAAFFCYKRLSIPKTP